MPNQIPVRRPAWPPASPNYFPPAAAVPVARGAAAPAAAIDVPEAYYPRYANFGQRALALIVDGLILGAAESAVILVLYGFAMAIGYLAGDSLGAVAMAIAIWAAAPAICLAIVVIYYVKGETGLDQGTIGKRLMGIKVVTLQGETISAGQSVGRLVSRLLSGLFFCLGYFLALFSDKRQALHDMIAGTLVVER